jgi:hypothetical protein
LRVVVVEGVVRVLLVKGAVAVLAVCLQDLHLLLKELKYGLL